MEAIVKGEADRTLHVTTTISCSLARERFGLSKRRLKIPYVKKPRAEMISQLREQCALEKQFKATRGQSCTG